MQKIKVKDQVYCYYIFYQTFKIDGFNQEMSDRGNYFGFPCAMRYDIVVLKSKTSSVLTRPNMYRYYSHKEEIIEIAMAKSTFFVNYHKNISM